MELLTTREVSQKYQVSEYTITQNWVPKGLKHFPFRPFRFKVEWIEEFIETQAELERIKKQPPICEIVKLPKLRRMPKIRNNGDMKINMEDFFGEKVKK